MKRGSAARQVQGRHWSAETRAEFHRRIEAGEVPAHVAKALGVGKATAHKEMKKIRAARGELGFKPVLPGYEIKKTSTQLGPDGELQREWIQQARERGGPFEVPTGHFVKGVSALVDGDNRVIQQWVKTKADTVANDLVDSLKAAFADYTAPAIIRPDHSDDDLLTVYTLPDLHLGMLSWRHETGEDYDLAIASKLVRELVGQLVAQSRPSKQAIVLGLGDMFHMNDRTNMTPRSGHILDVDGRWPKVLRTGAELCADLGVLAASRHDNVLMRFVPGNHDPDASVALTVALSMFFRNESRIVVDEDPGLHFYHRFGLNLIGATHGHTMSPIRMAMMLAADRAKDWGETAHRHFYFGHIHKGTADEIGGVRVESFNTPAAKDAHAHGGGWRSGRSMTAITFHRTFGEVGRHRVNIVPETVK